MDCVKTENKLILAHKTENGLEQTITEHLHNTAAFAEKFASHFNAGEYGYAAAMMHDIGKYADLFQARLNGSKITFEHSSAGAYELFSMKTTPSILLSYCVAGHHGGLPDGGAMDDHADMPTLCGKFKRQKPRIHEYQKYKADIDLHQILPKELPDFDVRCRDTFTISLFIRMIFSSLVDADYLDTENFMSSGTVNRRCGESLESLDEKLSYYLKRFDHPTKDIHHIRNDVLNKCLACSNEKRNIFRLTVPTGGGKTISSLAFALRHAIANDMQRIIYVIPYTSIITQTVATFQDVFGKRNVLGHYSTASYNDSNEEMSNLRQTAENWDIPIVVTTNVQFFESLFAAKPSRCRKLHNIANSVIVFDEVQMLPTNYLSPCARTIAELYANYHCSAVLCTATQPSIEDCFPRKIAIHDVYPDAKKLFEKLKRVTYKNDGFLHNEEIKEHLNKESQVLCIVNSRKTARELYESLGTEGRYYLSTYMYPAHIQRVLNHIRLQLQDEKKPSCKVVSTCLVEAGVDMDFPTVYREYAGLDSMIQAGGRCNREGKSDPDVSVVHIFESENMRKRLRSEMTQSMEAALNVISMYDDISSPEAIHAYFNLLYRIRGNLDKKDILEKLNNISIPFATVAKDFKLIESSTKSVLIPLEDEAIQISDFIQSGIWNRDLLRKAGSYCVGLFDHEWNALHASGCLYVDNQFPDIAVLHDVSVYSDETGITIPSLGIGVFIE